MFIRRVATRLTAPLARSSNPVGAKPNKSIGGVRYLNLHEYQAKSLLDKFKVQNQNGRAASTVEEAVAAAESILKENPQAELIVKAQIHAGGRGKGTFKNGYKGGVQICTKLDEVRDAAQNMLGQVLVTKQTGPAGQECNQLLINEGRIVRIQFYVLYIM